MLLKCADQSPGELLLVGMLCALKTSVALDVWSAGTILLSILGCKFPVFQAGDDIEALMELAAIFGRKTMEKCARLHSVSEFLYLDSSINFGRLDRIFSTNVPSVDHAGISWEELVTKINPYIFQSSFNQPSPESTAKHNHMIKQALDLLSKCLHWDATARITARDALYDPFLRLNGKEDVDDDQQFPHPPGEGKCSTLHYLDEHNRHVVMIPIDETKYITRVLESGEGIAIGSSKCEFHQDTHRGLEDVQLEEYNIYP